MKINSICQLIKVYNAIFTFFVDTGFGEQPDLSPHPALNHFLNSYGELDTLLSLWEKHGWKDVRKCDEKINI